MTLSHWGFTGVHPPRFPERRGAPVSRALTLIGPHGAVIKLHKRDRGDDKDEVSRE